jgi:hypothetical protein
MRCEALKNCGPSSGLQRAACEHNAYGGIMLKITNHYGNGEKLPKNVTITDKSAYQIITSAISAKPSKESEKPGKKK